MTHRCRRNAEWFADGTQNSQGNNHARSFECGGVGAYNRACGRFCNRDKSVLDERTAGVFALGGDSMPRRRVHSASDRSSARKHPMEYYRDQELQANRRIAHGCPTRLSAGIRWHPSHGQK